LPKCSDNKILNKVCCFFFFESGPISDNKCLLNPEPQCDSTILYHRKTEFDHILLLWYLYRATVKLFYTTVWVSARVH
jgi:hypothetical protein